MISYRTEGLGSLGVYRTEKRIGLIFWGSDKIWCFSVFPTASNKPVPTLSIDEMRDITGLMGTLDRTDNNGHPYDPAR